jgi:hypothetical protein
VIIIFGSNATFDAGQKGRFFNGDGSKGTTLLEIHDTTLKNGNADAVSKLLTYYLHPFWSISDVENCLFTISGNFLHFPMGSMSWRGTCNF